MLTYIVAWIATAVAFLGLDAAWLSTMTPRIYSLCWLKRCGRVLISVRRVCSI